ncbi:MAG: TlpA family protein disulfide reductase [Actinomycetota bacterium]
MRRFLTLSLALWMLAACGGESPRSPEDALLPEDRLELPDYDVARYQRLIAGLRGTPLVVNFWGSWCPPCQEEAPDLAEISKEYEGRIQFLGVDILDARGPAREFITRFDWPYPSIFDPRGAIRDGLGYVGQPITLVYDRDGKIAWDHVGAVDPADLRKEIDNVL